MFTGIVEEVGEIVDLNENEDGFKVSVKAVSYTHLTLPTSHCV